MDDLEQQMTHLTVKDDQHLSKQKVTSPWKNHVCVSRDVIVCHLYGMYGRPMFENLILKNHRRHLKSYIRLQNLRYFGFYTYHAMSYIRTYLKKRSHHIFDQFSIKWCVKKGQLAQILRRFVKTYVVCPRCEKSDIRFFLNKKHKFVRICNRCNHVHESRRKLIGAFL